MAYCSLTDVQELVPKFTFSDTTKPTQTQVESLITRIAAEIDNALEVQGVNTPVTSPANFVAWLQNLNALGVAYRAMQGMFPSTAEKDALPVWQTYRKDYMEGLKAIQKGEMPSAVSPGNGDVGSYYTDSANQGAYPDPVFRKSSIDKDF
jgi:hypothetical protein